YPQQPPTAQPGYGYPGQPQPGYGYPGRPQPGYGYQGQTLPPHPPGGGRKKPSAQAVIITAAAVAVALIIGAGVWYANSGGGEEGKKDQATSSAGTDGGQDGGKNTGGGKEKPPADVDSELIFQLSYPKVDDVVPVSGSWLTDKAYVKTGVNKVVGYDAASGTELWTVKLPGAVCAASAHKTEDNKTAILFRAGAKDVSCTEIGALDLDGGKLLWKKSVPEGDDKTGFSEVTVGAGTVAAGGTSGGAAFDIESGSLRWKPSSSSDGCYDAGYGGGEALVAIRKCGQYGSSRQLLVQTLDPVSGSPKSTYKMSPGIEYASIVSTKPLVVAADVGDVANDGSGISDFFSIDEKGKLRAKISADAKKYAARCGATEVESCKHLAVGNDRLYVPTEEHDGASGSLSGTNEIVAFDLATGKSTGQRADAGENFTIAPLRMDGGNIIAYKTPPYDKGGEVVSIDGSTFKETVLLRNPAEKPGRDAETSFSADYSEMLFGNGRLYISEVNVSDNGSDFGEQYLGVAFGVK
ncbi:PQQ-binding-like beta-propeller repeat protein, partial [Streptomyces sp. GC420]|uniref:outer membrane protein assembly factor BamB family protein n=1 Tax=Streptomyces sp. GC420 TaxID=2697568 RepID=UPI001414F4EE